MKSHQTCDFTRQSGFSLVEVTLAIGIAGFACLAMIGLSVVSFRALSDTRNEEIGRTIFQSVSGALANMDYIDLPDGEQVDDYDSTGFPTDKPGEVIYRARLVPRTDATFAGESFDSTYAVIYRVDVFHAPSGTGLSDSLKVFSAPVMITRKDRL